MKWSSLVIQEYEDSVIDHVEIEDVVGVSDLPQEPIEQPLVSHALDVSEFSFNEEMEGPNHH